MRIDEVLYNQQKFLKKDINKLFKQQKIKVNNQIVTNLSFSIDGSIHQLVVDGIQINVPKHKYFQLNKPKGYVSANRDVKERTIIDLIQSTDQEGLFSIGRLDKNTTGLILLTDNGPFGYYLTQEHFEVTKEYLVTVDRPLSNKLVELFNYGIIFDDGYQCKSAKLKIIDDYNASIIISEGKRHQIKKMFLSVGYYVKDLRRIRIDTVMIDDNLQLGSYRQLTTRELQNLYYKYERRYLK